MAAFVGQYLYIRKPRFLGLYLGTSCLAGVVPLYWLLNVHIHGVMWVPAVFVALIGVSPKGGGGPAMLKCSLVGPEPRDWPLAGPFIPGLPIQRAFAWRCAGTWGVRGADRCSRGREFMVGV